MKTLADVKMPPCDFTPPPYEGPPKEQVLETRKKYINPGIFAVYKDPVMIVDGHMQYLFDEKGTRYLDLFGGIVTVSVGHCHPRVIEKTQAQVARLQHTTTIYLHPTFGELAKKLASRMPKGVDVTYFTNSGSEANDLAMLMSRLHTGSHDIIAFKNAYHGGASSTQVLTALSTWKYPVPNGHTVHHVSCPDPYRSPYGEDGKALAEKCIEELRDTIRFCTPGKVAAFIAEPIQGVGGVTMAPPGYLKEAYKIVREAGGVCISDEVQTAFGRLGDHYWGFEAHDVEPDMITMAKGLGNGVPIGAVTTRPEIAETMKAKLHFNTFGGNPVSMAQALATLEVIDEENLQEACLKLGKRFKDGMVKLGEKHKLVGDVRGKGLMLGLELVKDRSTKEPATAEAGAFFEGTKEHGLLIGKGGLFGNVIRLKPPMCITREDVDFTLSVFDKVLGDIG